MKLKVIKKQWSYSEDLSTEAEKFGEKLKSEGATDIKMEVLHTDSFVGVAFTWKEKSVHAVVESGEGSDKPTKKK